MSTKSLTVMSISETFLATVIPKHSRIISTAKRQS